MMLVVITGFVTAEGLLIYIQEGYIIIVNTVYQEGEGETNFHG